MTRLRRGLRREEGAAMVLVLLIMVVLSGLGTIIFTTASSNMQNAGRDRTAGGAMGVSEAGVAQALAYMRDNGTGNLTCLGPPSYSDCNQEWGYNDPVAGPGGKKIVLSGGRGEYRVWIQKVKAYTPNPTPPDPKDGIFRIHSVGNQGGGPASRTVTTDVRTRPFAYPLGIFGRDYVRSGGTPQVTRESIFSRGCVGKRNNINMDTTYNDVAYPDLVPAVHSAQYTSTATLTSVTDPDCVSSERQNIHRPTTSNPPGPGVCNPDYRFDRDLQGGPLAATSLCHPSNNSGRGLSDSTFNENMLKTLYGFSEPRGLPADQYASIRQIAQAQGNYYNCVGGILGGADSRCTPSGDLTSSGFTALSGATRPNAVIYIKLPAGKTFTLGPTMVSGYGTQPPFNWCGKRSLLIVVEGGNLMLANNLDIIATTFVPDGRADVSGGSSIVGTLFSKELFLNGDSKFDLKGQCFFDNLPGGVQVVASEKFRQIDR